MQQAPIMTYERFEALLTAYGADTTQWPQDQRAAMQGLIATDSRAAALVAREAKLDSWLDAHLPEAPATLQDDIMAQMNASLSAQIISLTPIMPSRRAYGAALSTLAACFIFGFVIAPIIFDTVTAEADLLAALDALSQTFIPTEPL